MRPFLVLASTLLSLFGIYYINSGKTSLKQTGEVAGREEIINYTLPPSWVFSIWGLIYLGFLVYAIIGLFPSNRNSAYFRKTGPLVAFSMILNLVWTITVGLDRWPAAFPLQAVMLVLSIPILLSPRFENQQQKWLSIPFALYAGWLTVAMIPFAASLLNSSGWNFKPFAPITWAIIMYGVAAIIILLANQRIKNPFFLLPLVWAYIGFSTRFNGLLRYTALSLALVVLSIFLFSVAAFFKNRSFR